MWGFFCVRYLTCFFLNDEVTLFEGFCDKFLIFVGWVSFKCLEIVVVEEVMDFGCIVFSVYDDTCFTFISFSYHCIQLNIVLLMMGVCGARNM